MRRSSQPSVDTYAALLYRAGAPNRRGQVVVAFDPYAGVAEACTQVGVPCVTFVGEDPPQCVKDGLSAIGTTAPSTR